MQNNNTDENRAYEEVKAGAPVAATKIKKTVSLGGGLNLNGESPRFGGAGGNDSDSNRSSGGSGMFKIN